MSQIADHIVWDQFRNGSREALTMIFNDHIRFLQDYGYRMSSNYDLTRDCIQDLFVTLWTSRQNLCVCDNIRFYLMKSLRRNIVRALEAEQKTNNSLHLDSDFHIEFSHEFKLINNELTMDRKLQLQAALDSLTKRQRELIYHKYYNQLSNAEISELMGLSIQAVYNLSSKAIEVLTAHVSQRHQPGFRNALKSK